MNQRLTINLILATIFVLALAGVATGMFYLRGAALTAYGNEKGQEEWDRWRQEVAQDAKAFAEAENGEKSQRTVPLPPVKRRVSKSPEPPALLLMRDRFVVCLIASLLMSGAMIGSVLLLVRGAILSQPTPENKSG